MRRESLVVFIVDDLVSILEVVAGFLKQLGHRTEVFNDPREALAAFVRGDKVDLLISDYDMPHLKGDLLSRHFKKHSNGEIGVIIMSGNYPPTNIVDSAAFTMSRADAFLSKPFFFADFQQVIYRVFPELLA